MTSVDVHQHLWETTFVEALRARREPPFLDGWTLHLRGEPPYEVNPDDHDPGRRAALARADGVDRVLISLSSPLGIEWLPAAEARPLLDAYHDGALALPAPFAAWAAACVREIDADALGKELDRGLAGLQLPADALADAGGYARCAPLLQLLETRDLPLFIHPGPVNPVIPAPAAGEPARPGRQGAGPASGARDGGAADHEGPAGHIGPTGQEGAARQEGAASHESAADHESPADHEGPARHEGAAARPGSAGPLPEPGWWAALVPYVQQMHAAWYAFRAFGRPRHPRLRVCFAMLGGLAPLHGERLVARGGGRGEIDPSAYVETSSYGPRAADAIVRALGIDAVVHGTDRPYAGPTDLGLGAAARHALLVSNPRRLLTGEERSHAR